MNESIQIALISAGAALLGGLIGVIGTVIVNFQNIKGERTNKKIDIKREYYIEFINSMQTFINEGTDRGFYKFQEAINKVLVIANKETAKNVNDYYKSLVQSTNDNHLNQQQHSDFQTKIINSIRKDLKSSKEDLEGVSLVQYKK